MKNIIPKEQMTEWRHFESTVKDALEDYDKINDYFDCLIDCSVDNNSHAQCRRICREIL